MSKSLMLRSTSSRLLEIEKTHCGSLGLADRSYKAEKLKGSPYFLADLRADLQWSPFHRISFIIQPSPTMPFFKYDDKQVTEVDEKVVFVDNSAEGAGPYFVT